MRSRVGRLRASNALRSHAVHSDGICASQLGACVERILLHRRAVLSARQSYQHLDQGQIGLTDTVMVETLAVRDPDGIGSSQSIQKGVS